MTQWQSLFSRIPHSETIEYLSVNIILLLNVFKKSTSPYIWATKEKVGFRFVAISNRHSQQFLFGLEHLLCMYPKFHHFSHEFFISVFSVCHLMLHYVFMSLFPTTYRKPANINPGLIFIRNRKHFLMGKSMGARACMLVTVFIVPVSYTVNEKKYKHLEYIIYA